MGWSERIMEVKINGETREMDGEPTLAQLLARLHIDNRHLAIEHNGEFIEDGADLVAITIKPGDALEIVRFVGGG
jgi:thiamine biosynthesis protein ThiS